MNNNVKLLQDSNILLYFKKETTKHTIKLNNTYATLCTFTIPITRLIPVNRCPPFKRHIDSVFQ